LFTPCERLLRSLTLYARHKQISRENHIFSIVYMFDCRLMLGLCQVQVNLRLLFWQNATDTSSSR